MNEGDVAESAVVRVVLGDANVLYPRVLRDYLLYAADQEVISIAWSGMILERWLGTSPRTCWGLPKSRGSASWAP